MNKRKGNLMFIAIIVVVIVIIVIITMVRGNGSLDDETMQCIADNSLLIVSKTCSHCANQISILGDSKDLFNIVYIDENRSVLDEYGITGVPAWVINNEVYEGVRSIDKLKELTGC